MSNDNLKKVYYDLLNIGINRNELSTIEKVIMNNVKEYNVAGLNMEGICKVIANNISMDFSEKGITNRVINTNELLGVYEHECVIAYYKENDQVKQVLVDPSFSQFVKKENRDLRYFFEEWPSVVLERTEIGKQMLYDILEKGYTIIDDYKFNLYLGSFLNGMKTEVVLGDLLLKKNKI